MTTEVAGGAKLRRMLAQDAVFRGAGAYLDQSAVEELAQKLRNGLAQPNWGYFISPDETGSSPQLESPPPTPQQQSPPVARKRSADASALRRSGSRRSKPAETIK